MVQLYSPEVLGRRIAKEYARISALLRCCMAAIQLQYSYYVVKGWGAGG